MTAINGANFGLCNELFDAIVVKLRGKAICALSRVSKAFQEAVINSLIRQHGSGVDWFALYFKSKAFRLNTQLFPDSPKAHSLPIKMARKYIDLKGGDAGAFQRVLMLPPLPFKRVVITVITKKLVLNKQIVAAVHLALSAQKDVLAEKWTYFTITTLMHRERPVYLPQNLYVGNPHYPHKMKVLTAFRIASEGMIDLAQTIIGTLPQSTVKKQVEVEFIHTLFEAGRFSEALTKTESVQDVQQKLFLLRAAVPAIKTEEQYYQVLSMLTDIKNFLPQDSILNSVWDAIFTQLQALYIGLINKLFKAGRFSEALTKMESVTDPQKKISLLRGSIKAIRTEGQYKQILSTIHKMQRDQTSPWYSAECLGLIALLKGVDQGTLEKAPDKGYTCLVQ